MIAFLKFGAVAVSSTAAAGVVAVATGIVDLKDVSKWYASLIQQPKIIATVEPAQPQPTPELAVKSADKVKAKPAEPPAIAPRKPSFDVLRVEKDGSVVVAGNGPGDALVQMLLPDGTVVGETRSGPEGDFVIIPDQNLPAGDHVLTLQAMPEGAKEIISSAQSSVVHIPEKANSGSVLAMITESGSASRIVAKPEALQAKEPVQPKPVEAPVAVKDLPTPKPEIAETPVKPETVEVAAVTPEKIEMTPAPVAVSKAEPKAIAPAPAQNPSPVVVEAVEVEGPKVFVAGAVKKGTAVRVYIDNKPLGVARGTVDNRFLITKNFKLDSGKHTVRADVLDRKTGNVSARAEVPLIHETYEEKPVAPEVAKRIVPPPSTEQPLKKPRLLASAAPEIVSQPAVENDAAPEVAPAADVVEGTIRTGRAVIIKPGDNLWRISRKTYGRGIRYTTIYNANQDQIRDPNRIYIGQIFKIPEKYTR